MDISGGAVSGPEFLESTLVIGQKSINSLRTDLVSYGVAGGTSVKILIMYIGNYNSCVFYIKYT